MGTAYGVHSISEAPTTVHLHILPRLHTIQETGKRVAAIIKTGFTTGDWKSVGGLAPHAHCNLNSTSVTVKRNSQFDGALHMELPFLKD